MKDLEAKFASQSEQLAALQKAYDELRKDARMMVSTDAPSSTSIASTNLSFHLEPNISTVLSLYCVAFELPIQH